MKSILRALVLLALTFPIIAFAQNTASITLNGCPLREISGQRRPTWATPITRSALTPQMASCR